jgi:radical SAM-linked protein
VKLLVRYSKLGKVRFTSHRDAARLWERALRKAELPVAMSQGFTPRPRISFGLALPTGGESLGEYLVIELAEGVEVTAADLRERLNAAVPNGFDVIATEITTATTPSLQEDVVACTWEITLAGVDHDVADAAAVRLMAADSVMLERERKGERRVDDIRPAIETMTTVTAPDGRLVWHVVMATSGRAVRPLELVAAGFPGADALELTARVLRTHQWIERNGRRRELLELDGPRPARTDACGGKDETDDRSSTGRHSSAGAEPLDSGGNAHRGLAGIADDAAGAATGGSPAVASAAVA